MMETQSIASNSPFEGEMFLYSQPELLSPEDHGDLGLTVPDRPYEFARSVRAIPIAVSEIASCEKHYPVIFSNPETPALLAVLGIDDRNLFVDSDGCWEVNRYIPAYLRCHPFALASDSEDKLAVVIDRASASIATSPEIPFYEGNSLTSKISERIDFCVQLTGHRRQTQLFCEKLKELNLLVPRQVTRRNSEVEDEDEVLVATFASIDSDKLRALEDSVVGELNSNGMLAAAHGQMSSIENWQYFLARHDENSRRAEGGET